MSFDKQYVLKKLEEIQTYCQELEELLKTGDEEILKDSGKLHIGERLLQLIVDNILDINQHFIKELKMQPTEDFQSTFYTLGEHQIISNDFAQKLAPVVGLRNRIVHRYDTIDKKLFVKLLRTNEKDFLIYSKMIKEYLEK